MLKKFRMFILFGLVFQVMLAVIIGSSVTEVVASFNTDIVVPVLSRIFGDGDLAGQFVRLGPIPASYHGSPEDYAALKKAGVLMIGYGEFAAKLIYFVIIMAVVFFLVRSMERPAEPAEITLLREILDSAKDSANKPKE